jgi:hypothetical protein
MSLTMLRAGTALKCHNCPVVYKLPLDVVTGMLPLTLQCPTCLRKQTWVGAFPSPLPKIMPNEAYPACLVTANESMEELPELPEVGTTNPPDADELDEEAAPEFSERQTTFQKRADQIELMVQRLLQTTEELQADIEGFAQGMATHFGEEHRITKAFKDNYHPEFFQEFLLNPYTTLVIPTENEVAMGYSRLLLSPKFYNAKLGFRYRSIGGFRMELVNAFSRLIFGVNDVLLEYLALPRNLRLEVHGRKLIGMDLAAMYESIPGLEGDLDHCSEWPSVIIANDSLCRPWLAEHGVPAWQKVPLQRDEYFRDVQGNLAKENFTAAAWETFLNTGRLLLAWSSNHLSREFAVMATQLVKGMKFVVVGSTNDVDEWKLYIPTRGSAAVMGGDSFAFLHHASPPYMDVLNVNCKCLIIDLTTNVSVERLMELYGYKGKLIVLINDAVMDSLGSCEVSRLVYGLVAAIDYRMIDNSDEWKHTHMQRYREIASILGALRI